MKACGPARLPPTRALSVSIALAFTLARAFSAPVLPSARRLRRPRSVPPGGPRPAHPVNPGNPGNPGNRGKLAGGRLPCAPIRPPAPADDRRIGNLCCNRRGLRCESTHDMNLGAHTLRIFRSLPATPSPGRCAQLVFHAAGGILPRLFAAAVAELADALGSGPSGSKIPWRFDSSQPHSTRVGAVRRGFFDQSIFGPRFAVALAPRPLTPRERGFRESGEY